MRYLVLAVAFASVGCASHSPGSYSIDPACPAAVAEVVPQVADAFCEAGHCMGLRQYPKADWNVNCTEDYGKHDRGAGSAAFTTDRVSGAQLRSFTVVDALSEAWAAGGHHHNGAWRLMAHELGHAFGLDHNGGPDAIMSARTDAQGPRELDGSILCPLNGERCDDLDGVGVEPHRK